MKPLIDQLAQYGSYHRDARNILTHFFGVPMILLAVVILLSRPMLLSSGGDTGINPAMVVTGLAALYYLRLDLRYGSVLVLILAVMVVLGTWLAQWPTAVWLGWGVGLFVAGWIIQFVGHYWEGRKPAFMDDIVGLLIGPLFVLAEMGFALGWRKDVQQAVEQRCGPVRQPSRMTG